ncbi:MAG: D-glycerate dehydrogenase [Flavitalea sp.]
MKVFVTRLIPENGIRMMEAAGAQVTQWLEKRELTEEELIGHCQNYDALMSVGPNKIDSVFLNACRHLKVVSLMSVGYDNVDVPAALALNIPIGNTPGVLSGATADLAFLLMLAASRKAFFHHKRIPSGAWGFIEPTADLGIELTGKTLGIYGLGKIGFEMAKRCVGAYDMKIIYHNRGINMEAEQRWNAKRVSFDELLFQSDVLSVHTSLTAETMGIFNKSAFSKMKRSSIFINTARGGVHHEKDLTEAIQQRIIWGAGLDVTNPEPMHPDNPLLSIPEVAVLPHIGSATMETRNEMARLASENIIAGLNGRPLPYRVTL